MEAKKRTGAEIDSLQGLELRKAVAEEVLGYTFKSTGPYIHQPTNFHFWTLDLPRVESDLADAKLVLEKMSEMGARTTMEWSPIAKEWLVYGSFRTLKRKVRTEIFIGSHKELPVAICRAALAFIQLYRELENEEKRGVDHGRQVVR